MSKARASKAINNYDVYKRKLYPLSLEQYWEKTGKKKEFIRKRDGVKYPEYWIPKKTHKYLIIFGQIESYDYSTGLVQKNIWRC